MIRAATIEDHKAIFTIAKQSAYTKDFGHMMFSGRAQYGLGWIRVATEDERIVGFTCVRHKVRSPVTKLYFIGTSPAVQGRGFGVALLRDLQEQTPHPKIVFNVALDNERALKFYARFGAVREGSDARYLFFSIPGRR